MKTFIQAKNNSVIKFIAVILVLFIASVVSVNAQTFNMTNGTFSTCSGNFYDSGGPAGTYNVNENFTITFTPSTPGAHLNVLFTSFSTEFGWDALYVYNGPSTASPLISSGNGGTSGGFPAGGWWGTTLPGGVAGITSTDPSGALTFQFRSDASVISTGWAANISCISPPIDVNMSNTSVTTCNANFYDSGGPSLNYNNSENFTMTFTPSAGNKIKALFSSFSTEFGWDALYIYNGPSTASPLISSGNGSTSGGFPAGGWWGSTLPGGGGGITSTDASGALTFQFRSDFSVNMAGWAAVISCVSANPDINMTNGTFAACGGNFYDSGGPGGSYNTFENYTLTINPNSPGNRVQVLFNTFSTESNWDALYIYDGPTTGSPLISSGNPGTVGGFPAGGWWGTTLPGGGTGITSSDASGALTFVFRSDASVVLPGWSAAVSCVPAPTGPPGDICTDATVIACGTPVTATTVGYSNTGDPVLCGTAGAPSRWYKFTAQYTTATASLCGSLYDTRISAYSGSCGSPTCLADNDDFCGLASQISFPTLVGQVYYLRVYGFGSASGQFTLNVTCQVPGDACSGAVPIALSCPGPMIITGTTVGASTDASDSNPFCLNSVAPSVWYTFTGNGQSIIASLCGGTFYDSELSAYSGTCGSLTCITNNDDFCGLQSQIQFPTVLGQTYFIRVHGFGFSSGSFTLHLSCVVPPVNDLCSGVAPVTLTSGVPQVFTGTTVGASPDGGFYTLPTVWHAVTLTAPSQLTVRLCGTSPAFLDAWIIIANICPSTFFTDIFANSWSQDCGDGNWSVRYNCLPAGTYYIPVLGSEPGFFNPGPYTLTVTATSTPVIGTVTIVPAGGVACGPTGVLTVSVSNFSGALQWQFESPVGSGIWFNVGGATFSPITLNANLGVGQEFASFGIRAVASVCSNQAISNSVTYSLNNPNQPTAPVGLNGCGSAVGSISATPNPLPNHNIRWYSAAVGGTLLGTGSSLAVNVTSSTQYYAATINNTTGCEGSAARLQVNVTVFPVPTVTAGSNSPVCAGSAINLTSVGAVTVSCGGTFTIHVFGSGFGDETSWQFKNASNVVIASGGPYGFGFNQTVSVSSTNAPFTFTIETVGFFNDNVASYTVSCSGNTLVNATISGGQTNSVPNICCGAAAETPSTNVNMTNGTVSTCSANFYDSGGPAGNYTNAQNFTLTFTPSSPGASMRAVFNSFSTEFGWDALYIYNGPSIASPLLSSGNGPTVGGFPAGGWWGSALPNGGAAITSTDVSGALTFVFRSDFSVNFAGWAATMSCVGGPPPPPPYNWTGPNGYSVNAQNPSLTATPAAQGNYTVTFTTSSGCTATATTFVKVNVAPVISTLQSATLNGGVATTIPAPPTFLDIPVFTEALTCDKVVNYNVAISGDPAPTVGYSFSGATTGSGSGTGTGSTFGRLIPTGRTTVTVNSSNVCGSQSKQFRVTVTDNVAPVITPIQVPATNTNAGECASLVMVTQPSLGNGLFDNCPNSSLVFVSRSDGRSQFEPYYAGTTTVTWQATDASANTSTATQDVVVNNIKPVITNFVSNSGNVIFVNQTPTFTVTFTDEDGGGTHTVKFYRDKNDASPASTKVIAPNCTQSCTGVRSYNVTSDPILYSTSEVAEPKVEVLDGCNLAADQDPGVTTIQYLAIAVAGSQFTTAGGHYTMPAGGYPSSYEGFDVSMGNVVKPGTGSQSGTFKGQLEMNVHIPNAVDWRVHTDNGTNTDITWDYLTISGCSLATFKGTCRLNGVTGYKVLVQQSDKDRNPATSNFIRVKVTTTAGAVVFDTQPGLTEALTSGNGGASAIIAVLTGGSVRVHPVNNNCTQRVEGTGAEGEMLQNIPNPFTGQTEIRFNVPEDGLYTLKVYNYLGQEVTTLFNEEATAGAVYSVTFDGSNLGAGIYTYNLRSANVNETRKMNLMK